MLNEPWREGPPNYESDLPLGRRDRPIWVITTDREGRTDGHTIGYLHGKHGEAFELERARSIAWLKTPAAERGPRPEITIVPWLNVPRLQVDDLLSNWWNIKAWAEVEPPETTPALHGAVLGLAAIRDFMGLQLDLAWENISEETFHTQAADYLEGKEGELTDELEAHINIVAATCGLDAETLSEVFNVRLEDAIRVVRYKPEEKS